jgi:hypothetical protein
LITRRGLLAFLTSSVNRFAFNPSNDLALALPRLLIKLVSSWSNLDDSVIHPEKKKLWLRIFASSANSLLGIVLQRLSKTKSVSEVDVWWLNLFLDALQLSKVTMSTAEGGSVVETDNNEKGASITTILSMQNLCMIVAVAQNLQDADRTFIGSSDDKERSKGYVDLLDVDGLWTVHNDKQVLMTGISNHVFDIIVETPIALTNALVIEPCDKSHFVTSALSWSLSLIDSQKCFWMDGRVVKFLGRILQIQLSSEAGALLSIILNSGSSDLLASLLSLLFAISASKSSLDSTDDDAILVGSSKVLTGLTRDAIVKVKSGYTGRF